MQNENCKPDIHIMEYLCIIVNKRYRLSENNVNYYTMQKEGFNCTYLHFIIIRHNQVLD